jgi:Flp pilus assembly secretin CpaC
MQVPRVVIGCDRFQGVHFGSFQAGFPMTTDARSFMRRSGHWLTVLAAGVAAAAALAPMQAHADDLVVKFDQSQILRLSRPASEIIIGNPSIADVAIQSGNILVVTGKSFGITNIIALDGERNVIQDQRVSVRRDEVGVVNVTKGTARQTYACLPQCNPTITVGDDVAFMHTTLSASQSKLNFSEGSGGEKGAPSNN